MDGKLQVYFKMEEVFYEEPKRVWISVTNRIVNLVAKVLVRH